MAQQKLKVMMLGGLNEIGKNIAVFEYGDDIIVIDCGLAFPDEDMLGIDLVIPDITYLVKNADKIRGIFFSNSARILPVISPNKEILNGKSDIFDNFSSRKKGNKTSKPYLLIFSKRGNFLPKAFPLDIP